MPNIEPMSSTYYAFFLNMWVMKKITAEKLQTKVPTYLTQEECNMILATPQMT